MYRGEETAFAVELIARNVYVNGQYNPYARNEELKWPIPFVFFFSLSFFLFFYTELYRGRRFIERAPFLL